MTELVQAPEREAALSSSTPEQSPVAMMMSAIQQGINPDQIREMMQLQQQWQAIEAKKSYDAAFSAFKAESVRVLRSEDVKDGPLRGKAYAKLDDWVNAVTPALSKHGLSSSWKITKDEPDWLEVTCYLRHVGGHQESVSMGGPPDAGGAKNPIQARASSVSYLERYTLKAITGLSEENDDTDGNVYKQAALDEWVEKAQGAKTAKDLIRIKKDGNAFFSKARDRDSFKQFNATVAALMDGLQGGSDE